jgi:hypothetical protein
VLIIAGFGIFSGMIHLTVVHLGKADLSRAHRAMVHRSMADLAMVHHFADHLAVPVHHVRKFRSLLRALFLGNRWQVDQGDRPYRDQKILHRPLPSKIGRTAPAQG